MSIREIFVQASYWLSQAVLIIFLVWVVLKVWIVLKNIRSRLSGSFGTQGGSAAGGGRNRIGPRD